MKYIKQIQHKKNLQNQNRLTNHNFSLITSNCTGGIVCHWLGLQFRSPFVNLYMTNEDFVSALENFDLFLASPLSEDKNTDKDYPVGIGYGDTRIYFVHYENFEQANQKWKERIERITPENCAFWLTNWGGIEYILERFDKLPFKNKIVFVNKPYPMYSSAVVLRGFKARQGVGQIYATKNILGKRYIDDFDYVAYFNSMFRKVITMEILITVIVPIYNVKEYLNECVQSIVEQTYENMEIILIDDGSTDGSGKVCDEWKSKDARIVVIHQENGGLSAARNSGIAVARGMYITFVDSDDYIEPVFLEYLYAMLSRDKSDIASCQMRVVRDDDVNVPVRKARDYVVEGNRKCMKAFLCTKDINPVAWGKLYKSELFRDIRYPVGRYHEDVFTSYKVIAQSRKISVGSKALYCYRKRADSITTQTFSMKHLDAIYGKIEQNKFIEKNYSELAVYSRAGIVYAANQCLLQYAKSEAYNKDVVEFIKKNYREYERYFLMGKSSFKAKLFSLLACVNITFMIRLIRGRKKKNVKSNS